MATETIRLDPPVPCALTPRAAAAARVRAACCTWSIGTAELLRRLPVDRFRISEVLALTLADARVARLDGSGALLLRLWQAQTSLSDWGPMQ